MNQISYNNNSSFPNQVVPDAEKATLEYGLAVGRAIEGEWFRNYRGGAGVGGYATNYNNYHSLRLCDIPLTTISTNLDITGTGFQSRFK